MVKNIVLIVVDSLRRGNLGCYGYPCGTSPHIDKFAARAIIYDNAWAVNNRTDPCFTSIMTGLSPSEHGIIHHAMQITEEEEERVYSLPWLPSMLQEKGYYTCGLDFLGRWHKRGFDDYMGIVKEKRVVYNLIESIRKVFGIYPGSTVQKLLEKTPLYTVGLKLLFSHQKTPYTPANTLTDRAMAVLQSTFRMKFLFVHYWEPHKPYWPPKEFES